MYNNKFNEGYKDSRGQSLSSTISSIDDKITLILKPLTKKGFDKYFLEPIRYHFQVIIIRNRCYYIDY